MPTRSVACEFDVFCPKATAGIGRLEDLTVADAALPAELDDRAQDGWEPLIAIADAAGGDWSARARRAAVAIFGSRSAADDNPSLRLLANCREVYEGTTEDFLPTAELRTALITPDQSAWADIRGREVTSQDGSASPRSASSTDTVPRANGSNRIASSSATASPTPGSHSRSPTAARRSGARQR